MWFKKLVMESQEVFNEIKARLVRKFQPTKMYLFGSRAAGSANANSDYDFLLVVHSRKDLGASPWQDTHDLVRDLGVRVDCFVYTEAEFSEWQNEFSSIPETAVSTGSEIPLG